MATSRKFHTSPFKPVPVRPKDGGKLMSNVSADSVGIGNYTVKRDWRRVLDHEMRAEGFDYFYPNTDIPLGNQPFPNYPNVSEPITMTHQAKRPNGDYLIICGTPTTLFQYFSLSNGAYYAGDGTPDEYYEDTGPGTPYYDDNPGIWLVIGSGFSPDAQRWEVVDDDGTVILNNGVDLPITFDVGDDAVKPIYELRENGIASVGNISVSNGMLLCGDVSQISADALVEILSNISSNGVTASQVGSYGPTGFTATLIAGTVVSVNPIFSLGSIGQTIQFANGISSVITTYVNSTTVLVSDAVSTVNPGTSFILINPGTADFTVVSSAPIFDATMVGRLIVWDGGAVRTITGYMDPQHVTVDSNLPIPSGTFSFNNPAAYSAFSDGSNIDRIQYRFINSIPFEPRRWASTVPGSIMAGSVILKFQYPALSFNEIVGNQIIVLGAGTDGGNLTATLLYLGPDGMTAILDTQAVTTVTEQPVEALDAVGSIVGFTDLQDDGSAIIGMLDLLGNLVVYKDTAIFLGNFVGTQGTSFNFAGNTIYRGEKTLYYRNTLVDITTKGQEFHLFAGRNSFYRYDLVYQQPMEVEIGEVCKDIFFKNAGLPSPTDPIGVFAADNPITKEVFFCFPQAEGPDYALRFDYFSGQMSSTSAQYTAAAAVKRPQSGLVTGVTEDWFIMGTMTGTVLLYGVTSAPPVYSQAVTVSQSGNTLTASGTFFTTDMLVGKSIQFPDLSVVNITAYISPTQVTVGGPAMTRAAAMVVVVSSFWHRCGQPYDSVLQSGLDSFGNSFGEKEMEAAVISLGSGSPNTTFLYEILGTVNAVKPPAVLGSKLLTNPKVQNAVSMSPFIQNYFQDRITVSGINNPAELAQKLYNIAGVNSKAFVQR